MAGGGAVVLVWGIGGGQEGACRGTTGQERGGGGNAGERGEAGEMVLMQPLGQVGVLLWQAAPLERGCRATGWGEVCCAMLGPHHDHGAITSLAPKALRTHRHTRKRKRTHMRMYTHKLIHAHTARQQNSNPQDKCMLRPPPCPRLTRVSPRPPGCAASWPAPFPS